MAQKTVKKKAKSVLNNNKNVIKAGVVSGILGFVTALLLAPKSGKEIRGNISEQVTNAKDKTVELSGNTKTKFDDFKAGTTEKSKQLSSKFKSRNKYDDEGNVKKEDSEVDSTKTNAESKTDSGDSTSATDNGSPSKTTVAKKKPASKKALEKSPELTK